MTTPIGRDVPVGDWTSYREDQVLKLLHDFHHNAFNDGTLAIDLPTLCNVTGLGPKDADAIAERLVARTHADRVGPYRYRITDNGLLFIRAIAAHPLSDSR